MDQRLSPPFFDPAAMRGTLTDLWYRHGENSSALRRELLDLLKQLVRHAHDTAQRGLEADGNGRRCAQALSWFQDELIRLIYGFATGRVHRVNNPSSAERMAILATGGYGRGLMAPFSDVDLLFLLPYKQTPWGESVAEFILYLLWDSGFKVGHATRTAEQTIRFAKTDILTRTALLDARLVLGDDQLWHSFATRFRDQILSGGHREFITAKLTERDQRHERTGASRYKVEPNIKDGKGGLRDLHTLYWIAKHLHPELTGENFVEEGIYTKSEYSLYRRCEDFLWTVRCHLHFLVGKADETLSFDVQPQMAERLHYRDRGGMIAVERFMKHYFLVAKDVGDLTRILCSSLEVKQLKGMEQLSNFLRPLSWSTRSHLSATSDFRIESGRILMKSQDAFKNDPVNLIRIFAYAERYNVLFHPDALRLVRHSLKLIDDKLGGTTPLQILLDFDADPAQADEEAAYADEDYEDEDFIDEWELDVASDPSYSEHLQPAVRLGVALGLRVGDAEAQLGRPQRGQHRRVVGEDADLADLGPGRDLADRALEDLPLGGENLDVDRAVGGHR